MFDRRISIFTGHFGSGKTEIAVNFALKSASCGNKTAIADLDIVNPYFRTTDAKAKLEKGGVYVVTTVYANKNVDVPALPAEINTLFEKKEYKVVLDVGGDELGAKVLSRFRNDISEDDYEMYFVINTKRPMTDTVDKIESMIKEIEGSSRLKISKLVNNTNMLQNTCPEDVICGYNIVFEVSKKLDIPIGFTSGFANILDEVKDRVDCTFFYLDKYIHLPWDKID